MEIKIAFKWCKLLLLALFLGISLSAVGYCYWVDRVQADCSITLKHEAGLLITGLIPAEPEPVPGLGEVEPADPAEQAEDGGDPEDQEQDSGDTGDADSGAEDSDGEGEASNDPGTGDDGGIGVAETEPLIAYWQSQEPEPDESPDNIPDADSPTDSAEFEADDTAYLSADEDASAAPDNADIAARS